MMSTYSTGHDTFLQTIKANPTDVTPRLIYADWLDQQGDPQGELIRREIELADIPYQERREKRPDLFEGRDGLIATCSANYLQVSEKVLQGARLKFYLGLPVWPVKARHKNLKEVIELSQYNWVNPCVTTENFKIAGEIVVDTDLLLIGFDRDIRSDTAINRFDDLGLRVAALEELCVFGCFYSDIQKQWPIVALGSSCVNSDGRLLVPYLSDWRGERELELYWWDGAWNPRFRFLVVRK